MGICVAFVDKGAWKTLGTVYRTNLIIVQHTVQTYHRYITGITASFGCPYIRVGMGIEAHEKWHQVALH